MSVQLSVIVPVLNEALILPELFRSLGEQLEVELELVLCDGGSGDGTVELTETLSRESPFPVKVVTSEPGRWRQMNCGAAAAEADTLLFLHADSLFTDPLALRKGMNAIARATAEKGDERVAGHFGLRFMRKGSNTSSAQYYHLECKARLDRRECTHGDQGMLIRRAFFEEVGPYDSTFPILAETRLAEAVRNCGRLVLLPAEIHTSARRFETEGFYERQLLNAILMNFAAIGWEAFSRRLLYLYPPNDRSGRIQLAPLLSRIGQLISGLPLRQRLSLWYATGAYVRSHAWQIPLSFDTRRNYRRDIPPGEGSTPLLDFYDRYLDRWTDHPPGRLAAAALVWLWFRLTCLHAFLYSGRKAAA